VLDLVWTPTPGADYGRMRSILAGWEGTSYGSGQRLKGVAADCIGFACGALDELDGRARAGYGLLPPDSALHNRQGCFKAVAALRRRYMPCSRLRTKQAEPFDFVVVGPSGGGPGHLALVGPQKNTLWHCAQGSGVRRAGWSLGPGYEQLFAVYRLEDRPWIL
jgi:hypothetical protein